MTCWYNWLKILLKHNDSITISFTNNAFATWVGQALVIDIHVLIQVTSHLNTTSSGSSHRLWATHSTSEMDSKSYMFVVVLACFEWKCQSASQLHQVFDVWNTIVISFDVTFCYDIGMQTQWCQTIDILAVNVICLYGRCNLSIWMELPVSRKLHQGFEVCDKFVISYNLILCLWHRNAKSIM